MCLAQMSMRFLLLFSILIPLTAGMSMTPLSWDEAYRLASSKVAQMTRDEKNKMMHSRQDGANGWFVGNLEDVPRLSIPSLNMQDNGNGFRTTSDYMIGTVTCWPSALALAATWDLDTVRDTATAIGEEFAGKGANVILGPAVFVQRVAKGGRNFESIAGEDPYLGSVLGAQFVEGVQSQGVIATLKHFIFNSQENNRGDFNSIVDDHTAWNLYYPPFQAGVRAGAGAVMCSYNREDGAHSCSNTRRLRDDLKQQMGFRGFVMSDWGAEHGTSISNGEDMDMVLTASPDQFNANSVPEADVDEAVTRTVATIFKMHLDNTTKCVGGACDQYLHADVQKTHHELARKAATKSITLLKNNNSVLPLSVAKVKTIQVLGSAATAGPVNPNHGSWKDGDLYSGGGSGHVTAGYVVSPMDGIKSKAAKLGITVVDSTSDADVDVIIVVGGTTSHESEDRNSLHLDDGADDLISSAASGGSGDICPQGQRHITGRGDCCCDCSWANPGTCGHDDGSCCFQCCWERSALGANKTSTAAPRTVDKKRPPVIVLLQVPGVVLMPWADKVDAIAALFLGGQETGHAWASVLFGDYAPTGRLPLSIPKSEADTISPSSSTDISYSEGMATGYRDASKQFLFPFGHGLTYTTFHFDGLAQESCVHGYCLAFDVENIGNTSGVAVPQLYVEFPVEAEFAAPVLKGFQKTPLLAPSEKARVVVQLSEFDVTYWKKGSWIKPSTVRVLVGESSRDVRLQLDVPVSLLDASSYSSAVVVI